MFSNPEFKEQNTLTSNACLQFIGTIAYTLFTRQFTFCFSIKLFSFRKYFISVTQMDMQMRLWFLLFHVIILQTRRTFVRFNDKINILIFIRAD